MALKELTNQRQSQMALRELTNQSCPCDHPSKKHLRRVKGALVRISFFFINTTPDNGCGHAKMIQLELPEQKVTESRYISNDNGQRTTLTKVNPPSYSETAKKNRAKQNDEKMFSTLSTRSNINKRMQRKTHPFYILPKRKRVLKKAIASRRLCFDLM